MSDERVSDEERALRRVQFFGVGDLATGWYIKRVAEIVNKFDAEIAPTHIVDVIELHQVQQYLEHDLVPPDYTDAERSAATSRISQVRSTVAKFFAAINESNCASVVADVDYGYHASLLDLLGRSKAFERCSAGTMLLALEQTQVRLDDLLGCKKLVEAYGTEIRDRLIASSSNAEHIVRKHMQMGVRDRIHLPTSFTPRDARDLLERYLDSPDANPNYVKLIETAPENGQTGVDAKVKLRAKRRSREMSRKFFDENSGSKNGTEVGLSGEQDEAVRFEMDDSDGLVSRFTYSSRWLDETCDEPSILNNFQHLFGFVDHQNLLTLPSYEAQLGIVQRFLTTTGKTDYRVGAAFWAVDTRTLLQTQVYHHYLRTKDIELEEVICWFFEDYLVKNFRALNFSFRPSSRGTSYLEKVRHLFAEMESVVTQFGLFVEDGEIDRDLLSISSDPVRYKLIPSLVPGKYVYPTSGQEILGILHAMFSDQSGLTYISEGLKGDNAADLLLTNRVAYGDFHEYQRRTVDQLINLGILYDTGSRVRVANAEQFHILRSLFETEACSYYHLSEKGRTEVDAMVARGWVTRSSSLLTVAEAQYFNYFLNKLEFSNGPELRNKYVHGSQVNADGEDTHFHTYITALRLTIALVIKLNDDFCLSVDEKMSSHGHE